MAGHSKWANIQHRKGRQDAKRGKVFTKLIKDWPQNFHGHLTSYSQPWPSCYHIGLGSTFQKLFSLPESFEDSLGELMAFSNKRSLIPHPEFGFKDW